MRSELAAGKLDLEFDANAARNAGDVTPVP